MRKPKRHLLEAVPSGIWMTAASTMDPRHLLLTWNQMRTWTLEMQAVNGATIWTTWEISVMLAHVLQMMIWILELSMTLPASKCQSRDALLPLFGATVHMPATTVLLDKPPRRCNFSIDKSLPVTLLFFKKALWDATWVPP